MLTNQNPGVIGEDESSGLIKFALLHLLPRFLFFGVRCCPGSKEEREEGEMLRCLTGGGTLEHSAISEFGSWHFRPTNHVMAE